MILFFQLQLQEKHFGLLSATGLCWLAWTISVWVSIVNIACSESSANTAHTCLQNCVVLRHWVKWIVFLSTFSNCLDSALCTYFFHKLVHFLSQSHALGVCCGDQTLHQLTRIIACTGVLQQQVHHYCFSFQLLTNCFISTMQLWNHHMDTFANSYRSRVMLYHVPCCLLVMRNMFCCVHVQVRSW